MRRHAIGVIALVLLLAGAAFWLWPPSSPYAQETQAACTRLGIVMAVIWLAYHHLRRVPAWLWFALPVVLIVLARRPQWLLVVVPLLVVLAMLRPRANSRRPRAP